MPTPKPSPPSNSDDPEQSRRFIDMARELGVDEAPEAVHRAFERVTRASPPSTKGSQDSN